MGRDRINDHFLAPKFYLGLYRPCVAEKGKLILWARSFMLIVLVGSSKRSWPASNHSARLCMDQSRGCWVTIIGYEYQGVLPWFLHRFSVTDLDPRIRTNRDRNEEKRADARTKNSGWTGGRRHFWRPRPQNRATMAVRGGFDSLLHSFSFFAASSRTYRLVPVFDSIFAWLPGVL